VALLAREARFVGVDGQCISAHGRAGAKREKKDADERRLAPH